MKKIFVSFIFLLFAAAAAQEIPAMPGSLELKAGWNLVASPVEGGISNATIAKYCTIKSGPWLYDAATNEYKKSDKLLPFIGTWIKVDKACSVPLIEEELEEVQTLQLKKGWNIISNTGDFADLTGCTVTSGPWEYITATNSYTKATTFSFYKGYWLKVSADCTLKKKTVPVVPLPDLTIKSVSVYPIISNKTDSWLASTPVERVSPGQKFAVVVTIANQGDAAVDKNSFQVNVMPQGSGSIGSSLSGMLEPGQTAKYTYYHGKEVTPMAYTKTGVYSIFAEVDSFKTVPEKDETNNVMTVYLGVF